MPAPYESPYPKFDAHAHVCGSKAAYVELLDALNMRGVLNISFSDFLPTEKLAQYEEQLLLDTDRFPGRFHFCTSFSIVEYAEPGYADRVIAKLQRDFDERGAVAVKLWKDLGMQLRDADGNYVFCDDPAFLPVYDFIVERGIPILMHIADPLSAWLAARPSVAALRVLQRPPRVSLARQAWQTQPRRNPSPSRRPHRPLPQAPLRMRPPGQPRTRHRRPRRLLQRPPQRIRRPIRTHSRPTSPTQRKDA